MDNKKLYLNQFQCDKPVFTKIKKFDKGVKDKQRKTTIVIKCNFLYLQ